jgi:hypothetical protein
MKQDTLISMFRDDFHYLLFTILLTNITPQNVNNYPCLDFDISKFFCLFTTICIIREWLLSF